MVRNDDELPIVEVDVDGEKSQTDQTIPKLKLNRDGSEEK
jgi:hypothetical protein